MGKYLKIACIIGGVIVAVAGMALKTTDVAYPLATLLIGGALGGGLEARARRA